MLRTEFVTLFLSLQRYIYIYIYNKQTKKTIFLYNFYKYVLEYVLVLSAIEGNALDNIHEKRRPFLISVLCAPLGARTLDPNIKSVVLYQLS